MDSYTFYKKNEDAIEKLWKEHMENQIFNSDEAYMSFYGNEELFWEFVANLEPEDLT